MLRLQTNLGEYYDVTAEGNIIRLDQPGFKASGQWRLVGLIGRNARSFIPFDKIPAWLESKPELRYKNGNPRYTVRDYDHGTLREWGGMANGKPYGITAVHNS